MNIITMILSIFLLRWASLKKKFDCDPTINRSRNLISYYTYQCIQVMMPIMMVHSLYKIIINFIILD